MKWGKVKAQEMSLGDYRFHYTSWKQKRTLTEARKAAPVSCKFFILHENEQQTRITVNFG